MCSYLYAAFCLKGPFQVRLALKPCLALGRVLPKQLRAQLSPGREASGGE